MIVKFVRIYKNLRENKKEMIARGNLIPWCARSHSGDAGGHVIISKHIVSQSIVNVNRKTASLDAVSVAER